MTRMLAGMILLALPATSAAADAPFDYLRDVKPILARRCYACHGVLKQKAGLRLDTAAAIRKGSDSGPVIKPGNPADSSLIERVTSDDELIRMPPEGEPLSAEEIAALKQWIGKGATAPAKEQPQQDPRKHWSFQPPVRPPVPRVRNLGWVGNPIDAFIAAKHEKQGLTPRPPAEKQTLLRRVYLDLVGLPPTREELHAFLADSSPEAYEKVVEELLNSPQHGERWGRHWMDVWRYSDWYGRRVNNEIRYSQRHIWRWRDWIIESLNNDKGYDRMIVEMLAGDEVAPADNDVLRATGFLGRNWYKFDRNVWLSETIEQMSVGVLAVTMKCARCHDHKFDPITQEEYYRLRAFFEPHDFRIDPLSATTGSETDNGKASVFKQGLSRVFDSKPDAPTFLFVRGDDRSPDKDHPLTPAVPAVLGGAPINIKTVPLPVEAYYPALRPDFVRRTLRAFEAEVDARETAVKQADGQLAAITARLIENETGKQNGNVEQKQEAAKFQLVLAKKKLETARAKLKSVKARIAADRDRLAGDSKRAEPTAIEASRAERDAAVAASGERLLLAERAVRQLQPATGEKAEKAIADAEKKRDAARKALVTAEAAAKGSSKKYTPLGTAYPQSSTGRRLALARWITDRNNPRTARVAVNHIWLRHFDTAIVSTVTNFGLSGELPSHPALLDWLAVELADNGWSMKHIHRLIVTSNTYRMKSSTGGGDNRNLTIDPENRFLWRMNSRRMEAEVVRDSLLAAAGQLNNTMGGPELDEKMGQSSRRRSLYYRTTPDNKMSMLEQFDLANPIECYRRRVSVVPQQALVLSNSPLALDQSRLLARKLAEQSQANDESEFITAAFEQILGRTPRAAEAAACSQFLARQTILLKNTSGLATFPADGAKRMPASANLALRARENLVHVLFSHNDFVTIR